jgi:hypothetical protein
VRRRVLVARELFDQLESQLPEDPAPGLTSQSQFIARDLLFALRAFEENWDQLPSLAGQDNFHVLIAAGRLVPAFSIVGQLRDDETVELIRITIDTESPVDPDEPGDS